MCKKNPKLKKRKPGAGGGSGRLAGWRWSLELVISSLFVLIAEAPIRPALHLPLACFEFNEQLTHQAQRFIADFPFF